jgi:hypothetical protein
MSHLPKEGLAWCEQVRRKAEQEFLCNNVLLLKGRLLPPLAVPPFLSREQSPLPIEPTPFDLLQLIKEH